jgi:hypothetical protein
MAWYYKNRYGYFPTENRSKYRCSHQGCSSMKYEDYDGYEEYLWEHYAR